MVCVEDSDRMYFFVCHKKISLTLRSGPNEKSIFMLDISRYVPLIVTTEIKFKWTWNVNCTYFSQEIRRLLIIFLYMVRNLNSNWAVFKSNWKMCPCRVLVSFVTRSLFKGPSIYYDSKRRGWVGWCKKWQFLLTFSTICADVGWVSGSKKV